MKKEKFVDYYSQWSSKVLTSIVLLAATIGITDIAFGYGFSKNIYLLIYIAAGAVLAVFSVTWISILNTGYFKRNRDAQASPSVKPLALMTFEDIEFFIRREGYVPIRREDYISFKVSGEEIDVFYNNEKLSIVKTYGLSEDVDIEKLLKACSQLTDSTFLIRGSIHEYDDQRKSLVFEIQAYVSTYAELDRNFTNYLHILLLGIERHREIYGKLIEEQGQRTDEKMQRPDREHRVRS